MTEQLHLHLHVISKFQLDWYILVILFRLFSLITNIALCHSFTSFPTLSSASRLVTRVRKLGCQEM